MVVVANVASRDQTSSAHSIVGHDPENSRHHGRRRCETTPTRWLGYAERGWRREAWKGRRISVSLLGNRPENGKSSGPVTNGWSPRENLGGWLSDEFGMEVGPGKRDSGVGGQGGRAFRGWIRRGHWAGASSYVDEKVRKRCTLRVLSFSLFSVGPGNSYCAMYWVVAEARVVLWDEVT